MLNGRTEGFNVVWQIQDRCEKSVSSFSIEREREREREREAD